MVRYALILSLLFCGCSGSDSASDGGPSQAAIADAGSDEIMEMQRQAFEDITKVLSGVSDAASARAAKPKLEAIGDRLAPICARRDELMAAAATPEDKMAFGQAMMEMMNDVSGIGKEFTRLEGVEGVRDELEAPMQRIMGSLGPKTR